MQNIFITGANRGIGLELTKRYLERGERIFAACRQPHEALALHALAAQHGEQLTIVPLEVTDEAAIETAFERVQDLVSGLDLLINNAGILVDWEEMLETVTGADMMRTYEVNAVAPLLLSRRFLPLLRAGGGNNGPAGIVNLSSTSGSIGLKNSARFWSYGASKAALNMLTKTLANAVQDDNIAVIALHPGWVLTDMGTSNANISVEESVAGMLEAIDDLSMAQSGSFLSYTGEALPW